MQIKCNLEIDPQHHAQLSLRAKDHLPYFPQEILDRIFIQSEEISSLSLNRMTLEKGLLIHSCNSNATVELINKILKIFKASYWIDQKLFQDWASSYTNQEFNEFFLNAAKAGDHKFALNVLLHPNFHLLETVGSWDLCSIYPCDYRKLNFENIVKSLITKMVFQLDDSSIEALLNKKKLAPWIDKRQILKMACSRGSLAIAKRMIEGENHSNNDLTLAFENACENGQEEIIHFLLQHRHAGNPQLSVVNLCTYGSSDLIKQLWDDSLLDPTVDNTLLEVACSKSRTDLVKLLLSNPKVALSQYKEKAFSEACKVGNEEIVPLFLKLENLNLNDIENNPLELALKFSHKKIVDLLLQDPRIDPSVNNSKAFLLACSNGYDDVVRLFLENPRINSSLTLKETSLLISYRGHLNVLKILIEELNFDPSEGDQDVLVSACYGGHLDIYKYLISHPKINVQVAFKKILRAAFIGIQEACFKEILELKDVALSQKEQLEILKLFYDNYYGKRNSTTSVQQEYHPMITYLLQYQTLESSPDLEQFFLKLCLDGYEEVVGLILHYTHLDLAKCGHEALWLACQYNQIRVVSLLLEEKAINPFFEDNKCLRLAEHRRNLEIVNLFKQFKAHKENELTLFTFIELPENFSKIYRFAENYFSLFFKTSYQIETYSLKKTFNFAIEKAYNSCNIHNVLWNFLVIGSLFTGVVPTSMLLIKIHLRKRYQFTKKD